MVPASANLPPEVVFDRYFTGHPSPAFKKKYRGRLRDITFTDPVLAEALLGIRDEINSRYAMNAPRIKSPHGEPIIHMDYVISNEVNAFAFFHEGIAFVALTSALLQRLIHITSQLWRLNLLGDLLRVTLDTEARNRIAATSIPLQIQILSSHEVGHVFHGHCGESCRPQVRAEVMSDFQQGVEHAHRLRDQAMEVEADGYAAHMMLTNLFGGVGDYLFSVLKPGLAKEEFILTYFLLQVGSLFYLWGPRSFDPQAILSYDHPPALMRLNVFMRDIEGWSSQHKPELVRWGTLDRFQQIMRCVSMADEESEHVDVWLRQGEFLRSEAGSQYIRDLYKSRETLRAEMSALQWLLTPGSSDSSPA